MDATLYTIQAMVTGIGWLTFYQTKDAERAERLEHQAAHAADSIWPGKSPRRTRILIDGQPAAAKPSKLFAEPFVI